MNSFRIAISYESRLGRNDGNPLYVHAFLKRLQYYSGIVSGKGEDSGLLRWFIEEKGDDDAKLLATEIWEKQQTFVEADHLAPLDNVSLFGSYDLWLDVDWGEDGLTGLLPYEPIKLSHPLAVWVSDTHLGYEYRLKKAKQADYVFCAQKRAVQEFKRDGIENPIWLPHAFEPLAYPKFDLASKKFDVCFVGHVNSQNRLEALNDLFKAFPNFYYGQRRFEEASRKFAESRISFNIAMLDDINMRTFEVMGSGNFLLTNRIDTIEEFFLDKVHCALYSTPEEMIDVAQFYLAHESERNAIAEAGYQETKARHKIADRVRVILDTVMKPKEALCK